MTGILLVAATEPELCGHQGVVCGVGPVDAAAAVAASLARERPAAVVHVGAAGARIDSGVSVLDVVVGGEAVYEDLVTSRKLAPDRVTADPGLVAAASAALEARVITIGTTARVGGGSACAVEAMEGFAVLRAAALAGVPAVEVRVISNLVEDVRAEWRLEEAIAVLADAVPRLLGAVEASLRSAEE